MNVNISGKVTNAKWGEGKVEFDRTLNVPDDQIRATLEASSSLTVRYANTIRACKSLESAEDFAEELAELDRPTIAYIEQLAKAQAMTEDEIRDKIKALEALLSTK